MKQKDLVDDVLVNQLNACLRRTFTTLTANSHPVLITQLFFLNTLYLMACNENWGLGAILVDCILFIVPSLTCLLLKCKGNSVDIS